MSSKPEVNQKSAVYSSIISRIKELRSPYGCVPEISKQNLYKNYLKRLISDKIVFKTSHYTWSLTEKYQEMPIKEIVKTATKKSEVNQVNQKSSLGTRRVERPETNLHALQINFPIRKGKIYDSDWQMGEKLNHWLPKYKKLSLFGGITIKNNNNKSLTVFVHSRNIKSLHEVDDLTFRIRLYITEYFKKEEVYFDWDNIRVKNLNLATEDKPVESLIRKGEKFELDLKKKSEKILPKDDIDGKAWIDGSPFKFSAETNDKEWKRWYLAMPFGVRDSLQILSQIQLYAEEIRNHRKAIEKMSEMAEEITNFLKTKKI